MSNWFTRMFGKKKTSEPKEVVSQENTLREEKKALEIEIFSKVKESITKETNIKFHTDGRSSSGWTRTTACWKVNGAQIIVDWFHDMKDCPTLTVDGEPRLTCYREEGKALVQKLIDYQGYPAEKKHNELLRMKLHKLQG